MKRYAEPLMAMLAGLASYKAWNEILLTCFLALMTGALGFLGKYLMQRTISWYNNRKNKKL